MATPKLDRHLTLEAPNRAPDGSGGFTETWVALGTLWAEINPGAGREKAGDFLTLSTTPLRIIVRAAPVGAESRPKPDQRFVEGSRVYRIRAVTEHDPSGMYLTCFAQEEEVA